MSTYSPTRYIVDSTVSYTHTHTYTTHKDRSVTVHTPMIGCSYTDCAATDCMEGAVLLQPDKRCDLQVFK